MGARSGARVARSTRPAPSAPDAFRLRLNDRLRLLADARAIQAEAARLLGEHLDASRVAYFEVIGSDYLVDTDYARGVASIVGRYPVAAFGAWLVEQYRRGQTVNCPSVTADPALSAAERAAYAAIDIAAHVGVPLVKAGRLVAGFAVHQSRPRVWRADEIALIEETAERTWAALERMRAERALRDSEARYRQLFEQVPDGVFVATADGRYSDVNDAGCQMLGMTRAEVLDCTFLDVLCPEEHARLPATIAGFADGRVHRSEWRFRRKDGSVFTGELAGRRLPDGALQGVLRDITEQIAARRRLQAAHDLLYRLVDESPFGVYLVAADFTIAQLSAGARAAFAGVAPVIGRDLEEVLHAMWTEPFASEAVARFRHTLATGEPYHAPATTVQRRDRGVVESYDWRIERVLLPDGRDGVVCHFYDLSERERMESALRDSERNFRLLADAAPAMLWITGPDGGSTYVSQAWRDYTGRSLEDALGAGWTEPVHPDDRAAADAQFMQANARHVPFRLEYRLRRANGDYRWVIDQGRPRFDDGGRFLGYVGAVIDVHERRLAEDAIVAADRRKDEFLAVLAHELRNPLAPLRNGMALLKLAHDDPAVVERTRAMMDRQLQQLVRLIDDLLDVARIARGKLELRTQPMALAGAVRAALETSQPLLQGGGHALETELDDTLQVSGDAVRLAQVAGNLLNNAARYTPAGGRIGITLARDGADAVLTVQDNGIGVPPAMIDRIFEPFTQVPGRPESAAGGLGVGLALARTLVQLHGGSIRAENRSDGSGSRFTVRLPLAAATADAALAAPAAGRPAARRVLIVDDNVDAAESLAQLLAADGHDVRCAHGGAAAVALAPQFLPEVVLLDLSMPEVDGFAVARALRADPRLAGAQVVAVSGFGQPADRQRTTEAGFDAHLVKPLDPAALDRLLARRRGDRPPDASPAGAA